MQMRCKFTPLLILLLTLLLSALLAIPVLAGDGDGSGGGQGVPLQLAASSPSNGQSGVAVTAEIKLTFNKNVINMTVKENNQKCFSLTSADGKNIPIQVIMADDQINPELKREVGIKPLQVLESGTTYTLNIDGKMQGKSGAVLGSDVKIAFTTGGTEKTDEGSNGSTIKETQETVPEEDTAKTPDSTVTSDSTKQTDSTVKTEEQPSDNEKTVASTDEKETQNETEAVAEQKTADGGGAPWLIVVLVVVLIAGTGYAFYLKRKR